MEELLSFLSGPLCTVCPGKRDFCSPRGQRVRGGHVASETHRGVMEAPSYRSPGPSLTVFVLRTSQGTPGPNFTGMPFFLQTPRGEVDDTQHGGRGPVSGGRRSGDRTALNWERGSLPLPSHRLAHVLGPPLCSLSPIFLACQMRTLDKITWAHRHHIRCGFGSTGGDWPGPS